MKISGTLSGLKSKNAINIKKLMSETYSYDFNLFKYCNIFNLPDKHTDTSSTLCFFIASMMFFIPSDKTVVGSAQKSTHKFHTLNSFLIYDSIKIHT